MLQPNQQGHLLFWISKHVETTTEQLDEIYGSYKRLPVMAQIVTLAEIADHPNTSKTTLTALLDHNWPQVSRRARAAWSVKYGCYVH